jgi:CheY-like chemotaxis protein
MGGSPPTILVVDDDVDVLALTCGIVQSFGYVVIPARSGEEALSLIHREPAVSVMFTDIRMPGMDGWELADLSKHIRPDLQIIYTTGYSHPPKCAGHGPLLPKPWRPAQLEVLLRQTLDRAE